MSGENVAVKIQFPGLKVSTDYDLWVTEHLLTVIKWATEYFEWRGIDYRKFFGNFKQALLKELDFTNEARNSELTQSLFEGDE